MRVQPKQKQTTIAYRCPACGKQVFSVIGVFALSGDFIKLKCECGQSELSLMYTPNGKVRFTVPCFLCASNHQYVVDRETLLSRDLLSLTCTCSDQPICLTGQKDNVLAAAEAADTELQAQMEQAGFTDFSDFHPNHETPPA